MVGIIDFTAYGDAFGLGWIFIDGLANAIVASGEGFTTIRVLGARFISRDRAIVLSIAQVVIAMVVSYFIVDWIFGQLSLFSPYIIPITLGTFGVFYGYILATLPYDITLKRLLPSIIPIAVAILIYYLLNISR